MSLLKIRNQAESQAFISITFVGEMCNDPFLTKRERGKKKTQTLQAFIAFNNRKMMLLPWQQMIKEDNQSELRASPGGYFSQEIATISRRLLQDSLVQNGPFKGSLQ